MDDMTAWELFELISSAAYGKECYFKQPNGIVYSRISNSYMSEKEALGEFISYINEV